MKIEVVRQHITSQEFQLVHDTATFFGGNTSSFEAFGPMLVTNFEQYKDVCDRLRNTLDPGWQNSEKWVAQLPGATAPVVFQAFTNGERGEGQESGFYYTELRVELDKADLAAMYELEFTRAGLSRGWFRYDPEHMIKFDGGSYLISHFGKYTSGLRILVDIRKESLAVAKVTPEELGVAPDGDMEVLYGEYFISKKGQKYFRVKAAGPHMMIRQGWGGAFASTSGNSLPQEDALYYNRRRSSGGGMGCTWAVFPRGWTALEKLEEKKLEFNNVKVDFGQVGYDWKKAVDKTRYYFQIDHQGHVGVKIYVNDYREKKDALARVVCRTKGDYSEIDIYGEATKHEPEYLLAGVSLYSNWKNYGASTHIDINESVWGAESSSGGRTVALFLLEKGKRVTLKGAHSDTFWLREDPKPEQATPLFGTMPASTYFKGNFTLGIKVENSRTLADTKAVILGEEGRGRKLTEILVTFPTERLASAGIGKLADGGLAFIQTEQAEKDAQLVRVVISASGRGHYSVSILHGEPKKVAAGMCASGAAGFASSGPDELWVMRPGDGLVLEGSRKFRVIENQGGNLVARTWLEWELADAKANPAPYIQRGLCPGNLVPKEWVGRVVVLLDKDQGEQTMPYHLVGINPVEVDMDWNVPDRTPGSGHCNWPSREDFWVQLTDLVAEAPMKVTSESDFIEFSEPFLFVGTQVTARVTSRIREAVVDRHGRREPKKEYLITVENVPAQKKHIQYYEKGGSTGSETTKVEGIKTTFVLDTEKSYTYQILCDLESVDGIYTIEVVELRQRGRKYLAIQILGEAQPITEETIDLTISMGKNCFRDPSHIWVIGADGSIVAEKSGEGTASYKGLPKSVLVLRHRHNNYGYTESELWEVFHKPDTLTKAQIAKAGEIAASLQHRYFTGEGTTWDLSVVGMIEYKTPYYRDFSEQPSLRAMQAAYPVDVAQYKQRVIAPQDYGWQDAKHPTIRMVQVWPE